MAATAQPTSVVEPIRVPMPVWLIAGFGMLVFYLALMENGALLAGSWGTLHEFFHDGRHAFGLPCH